MTVDDIEEPKCSLAEKRSFYGAHQVGNLWKLIARTISPTPLLFVAQRPSTYSRGNMGKFGAD